MTLVDQVREAGVVGAGGGGFPAHIKLSGTATTIIANGAECEPLLHKDAVIMERLASEVVRGVELCMDAVGANRGVVGIKGKKRDAVAAISEACRGTRVELHLLGDYYPAGDEYDLVYEVTGQLIPPGGIPLQVGAVVQNVETLVNIAAAAQNQPVLRKTLTVAGAVEEPLTLSVPIGTSFREVIEAAGGLTVSDPVLCIGGLMMGQTTEDLDTPITKTTTGVVVLSHEHPVIRRKLSPAKAQAGIGKSACDQCRYCTELCPRYLLGYAVEPHQVMRSLAFTATGAEVWNEWAALCCSCGLCTLYSCPEALFPKEACDDAKQAMRAANRKWEGSSDVKVHGMREGRHVSIRSLTRKLSVTEYDRPAPWVDCSLEPARLVVPLKQSAGVASQPVVQTGQLVREGEALGSPPPKTLGATVHSPMTANVEKVTTEAVYLTRA